MPSNEHQNRLDKLLEGEGGCLREGGGDCLKYLKRWWNRKEGGKKGGGGGWKLGERGGALKRGLGTPLRTMRSLAELPMSESFFPKFAGNL